MLKVSCSDVIKASNGMLISGSVGTEFLNINTDSRKISQGDLFVPIKGEKFDGHDFIESSLAAGAAGALTAKDIPAVHEKVIIRVEDTLKALGHIAQFYRQKFPITCVGITGSVGKTSTKDMVACVLEQKYKVLKTEGNFNNEIGMPLTMLKLDPSHEVAVVEMGMRGFGEISYLTSIARPDIAIITNIGMSHIERLGSRQNILKAKLEILEGLSKSSLVILNGDDSLLYGMKDFLDYRTVFYGLNEGMDYRAYNLRNAGEEGSYFTVMLENEEYEVYVPVPGIHNVNNALAAIAAGIELRVPIEKIIEGITGFKPTKMRLDIVTHEGFKVINDTYNASPQSMEAAISVLKDIAGNQRKIAVLGDMLELGEWSRDAHREIGEYALAKGVDLLVTLGDHGKYIAEGALNTGVGPDRVYSFDNNPEAAAFLEGRIHPGDVVLVKGSRGMKMEEIVQKLTE